MIRKFNLAEPSLGLLGGKDAIAMTGVVGPAPGGAGTGPVLAGAGRAASVGQLSVPQSWATATPQSPAAGGRAVPAELGKSVKPAMEQPPLPLGPMRGSEPHHAGNAVFRMRGDGTYRMPRPAVGG
jgi:PPE-repeat protein